jgi:hypothetical protein
MEGDSLLERVLVFSAKRMAEQFFIDFMERALGSAMEANDKTEPPETQAQDS